MKVYIVMPFVFGIYISELSSMYLREYLATPPIIENKTIAEKM
tara:strand:+ start:191 stop:319 length:129 start_codon:yes stop_codon:yes gene_type:complete